MYQSPIYMGVDILESTRLISPHFAGSAIVTVLLFMHMKTRNVLQ